MPQELGFPKYYKWDDVKPGTQVVSKGEYIGSNEGAKGTNHNFIELETNQHVVLNGRNLGWRIDQGHIAVGEVLDIYFEGKKELTKGEWKGSKAIEYRIDKYTAKEVAELVEAGATLRNEMPAVEAIPDARVGDANESLGNLE